MCCILTVCSCLVYIIGWNFSFSFLFLWMLLNFHVLVVLYNFAGWLLCGYDSIKFLDAYLYSKNGIYVTKVYRKETQIPVHWSSQIPRDIKKNIIKVDLHHAKKISDNFKEDFKFIRNKFLKACFLLTFNNSVIKDFIYQKQTVRQNSEE